ncbi:HAD family hydrolase [Streptosporangium minutum]|uniref:Hydrolase n=1 Tax=Streptosporangium minutum TaxID=569862 RepID=A0A243QVA1_9ACTN|nr:HAD family phosphatase [Streptosporangium minutum]OUC86150.1 hydrolase [Streptosporangium minutum]
MSAELRAVLFDMDGTLVDTEGLWWEACAAVAAELGLELAGADAAHVLGRPVEHAAAHLLRRSRARRDRASTDGTTAHPGRALPGDSPTRPDEASAEAVGARLTEAFAERIAGGVTPLPGAIRLLDDLGAAGVPVALVSASPRRIVDMVLRTVGAERFRLVVAAEDTARGKPLPDPYLKAAAALGVDPAECVAVEDSPTGLAAARAAGCRVIAVPGDVPVPYGVPAVDSLEKVDLALLRLLTAGKIWIS